MGSVMDQERPWEREARVMVEDWKKDALENLRSTDQYAHDPMFPSQEKERSTMQINAPMSATEVLRNHEKLFGKGTAAGGPALTEAQARKQRPLATGVLDYFPDALLAVAHTSFVGNEQHNPGQPLHWAKGKSTDHADALMRHLKDRGTVDTDGILHSAKVAWRALALLQTEIEHARTEAGNVEKV